MANWKKPASWPALLALLSFFPVVLQAQNDQDKTSKKGGKANEVSLTGCLRQGSDKGGYFIIAQDGKMYELWGKGLKEHPNHTVTITGTPTKPSQAEEATRNPNERSEAQGEEYADLKVSSLKMVSESCK